MCNNKTKCSCGCSVKNKVKKITESKRKPTKEQIKIALIKKKLEEATGKKVVLKENEDSNEFNKEFMSLIKKIEIKN